MKAGIPMVYVCRFFPVAMLIVPAVLLIDTFPLARNSGRHEVTINWIPCYIKVAILI